MLHGYFQYLIFMAPAALLMMWAQMKVRSSYRRGMRVDARLSGAAAARYLLDSSGLHDVGIEEARGFLSDHYDPSHRVLRLSHDVYHSRSATAVGIAAHEAGHALQHAKGYAPLVIRNAAVPAAQFGPWIFMAMFVLGMILSQPGLLWVGVIALGGVALFQLINLPVEFDASNRAKVLLVDHGIINAEGSDAVRNVLNAAGWTYVAATLQSILQVAYYALQILGAGSRDD